MRILVVGAGATGGYFGARLLQAGRNVTFLVRPGRAETLRKKGLQIRSPHGDANLNPTMITADEIEAPYDVIFLSVKAWSLADAMNDFAPAVGAHSMILPVLNGMKHMDQLKARFGSAVIGGVCRVATDLGADGSIVQLMPFHELAYGELNGESSERIQALDSVMQGSGFDAKLSTEITRLMWEKWALLATMGAATCLMRGNIGQIASAPNGESFMINLFDEVVGTIERVGCKLSDGFLQYARGMLTQKDLNMNSSMNRDLEKGSRIEHDQIIDDLIARARKAGLPVPLLTLASTALSIYDGKRS
ncbi:MAG TPA: 2-dehydropantoate 2-reductase [Rhodocyclaceae bacterium]|nr:2-dehydropantoate 2-reductase [Rhodocyclaceae bacterium]